MSEEKPDGRYTQLELIRQEEKAFQKFAAMRLANDDKVSIPKIYFDITEDFAAAAVLDEILFWTLPNKKTGRTALRVRKEGVLWLAVTRTEWWERKRVTERQADRAIELLIEKELIEKSVHRFNGHAQMHLRVRAREFFEAYGKALQKEYLEDGEQDDDPIKDIDDLYALMGMDRLPKSDSPNGDAESPNRDGDSPNGDTNNSLQPASNQPPDATVIPSKPKTKLPENAGLDWKLAAGYTDQQLANQGAKEQHEREVANLFEQQMGFNPLPWWSEKDLTALLKFLLDQTPEDIALFCAWVRRPFSAFGPEKARRNPRQCIDLWPQAFTGRAIAAPKRSSLLDEDESKWVPAPERK